MGNPFTPDPTAPRDFGKYVDRAQFMGDAGRSARAGEDSADFQALLDGEVEEELPDPLSPDELENLEAAAGETATVVVTGDLRQDADELEARREKSGREETEKRTGSWQGPHVLAGLPGAANLGLIAAVQVQQGERSRGGNRAAMRIEIRPGEARVDPELIEGLLEAGLRRPLSGLEDPRLASAPPHLAADEGWRTSPTAKGVAIHWEGPTRTAYQRLEWSDGNLVLETAAGTKLQTLERQGGQIFVRHSRRDVPPSFPV